jgi:protein TonB
MVNKYSLAWPIVVLTAVVSCTINQPSAQFESGSGSIPRISVIDGQGIGADGIKFAPYVPPVYPRLARQAGLGGAVQLEVTVHADGTPGSVTVVSSSGTHSIDDAAVEAAEKCRYDWIEDNKPVDSCVIQYTVIFELD